MRRHLVIALRLMILFTIVCGIAYPLLVTGLSQWWFPHQANGSLLRADGRVVGSAMLGQTFTAPRYFHPRPSAAGKGYDAMASGGTNLTPASADFQARVTAAVAQFRRENPQYHGPVPADMVTASGSGLDPDISPEAALAQAPRVAAARGLPLASVNALVRQHVQQRTWDLLGEPRVNVLELNLALDVRAPALPPAAHAGSPR